MATRKARIHLYFGTVDLPDRQLSDSETAHDIIEVDIGENEEVKEIEMERVGAKYDRRMQTQEEANTTRQLVEDGRAIVKELGGTFTGRASGRPKMVNERVKGISVWRYRLVTLEHIDVAGEGTLAVDAGRIEELPPGT